MAILEYKNDRIIPLNGNHCMIHDGFKDAMDFLCKCLSLSNLYFLETSSKRCSLNVPGAIVTPATHGDHLVAHAVDGNLKDKTGKIWTSKLLEIFAPHSPNYNPDLCVLTNDVYRFIDMIRKSNILRWGGDFVKYDTVHLDDNLYLKNPARWQQIYNEINSVPNA